LSTTVTWLNLLSGLGMFAIGLVAMAYWYFTKHTKLRYFAFGGLLWAAAILPKLIMDLTITAPIQTLMLKFMPVIWVVVAMSLYVGLRTGFFESGITYLAVKYTKLSKIDFNEAVALGIGFGGAEAMVLGLISFINVAAYIADPGILMFLPAETLEQFAVYFIPLPVLERLLVLFCHIFATVLVVYAVKLSDLRWLAASILFKTAIDGPIPLVRYIFSTNLQWMYLMEAYLLVLGIISIAGLYWIYKKYGGATAAPEAGDTNTGH
jgi:uncharacterized membrane protein YhfC